MRFVYFLLTRGLAKCNSPVKNFLLLRCTKCFRGLVMCRLSHICYFKLRNRQIIPLSFYRGENGGLGNLSNMPKVRWAEDARPEAIGRASNPSHTTTSTQKRAHACIHSSPGMCRPWARHWDDGDRKMPELRFQRSRQQQKVQDPNFQADSSRLQYLEIRMVVRRGKQVWECSSYQLTHLLSLSSEPWETASG